MLTPCGLTISSGCLNGTRRDALPKWMRGERRGSRRRADARLAAQATRFQLRVRIERKCLSRDKEMNMKSKRPGVLLAAAVVLLSFAGAAHSANVCSAAILKGAYAFSAHGEVLGLLDSAGYHPLATPQILDDVAIVKFDGSSQFARTDFGNINGAPKNGQTTFNPDQSGAYTVNGDCTGTMTITYNSGVVLNLEIVVGDDGTLVKAIIATEIVPSIGPTADGTTCSANCSEAVQVSLEGKKANVFGFR
jgi:hypothetical protein